jgi:hypothetical protein
MKTFALAIAATLIGSAAFADETTVIRKEGPLGDTTVVTKERDDSVVTKRTYETTGSLGGCEHRSVTKTNELGDSVTKSKTEC